MKLYEIKQLYNDTLDQLIEEESTDLSIMDELEGEFNEKAIATASFFKNMEADINAIKEAEKQMRERRSIMENKVARLKDYLLRNMIDTDITKIECPYFAISVKNNPPSVSIVDEAQIPSEYKKIKTTETIDKVAIKKAGGCPGVEIVRTKSLSIK